MVTYLFLRLSLFGFHERIHSRFQRRLLVSVHFHERFQDSRAHMRRGFVSADILLAEDDYRTFFFWGILPVSCAAACTYFLTAMACSSKWPPAKREPAPMNSRAG